MNAPPSNDDDVLAEETWAHAGLRCRVVKLGMGHYCGYVRSALDSRLTYDDIQRLVDVHGGLTYGVDDEGWVGFDCAHAYDRCVDEDGETWGTRTYHGDRELDTIWAPQHVKAETEDLAEQIAALQAFAEKVSP